MDKDDLSQAPTQILLPAQMMQYHTWRWQQELLREQGQVGAQDVPHELSEDVGAQGQAQQELTDAPTVYNQGLPDSAGLAQGSAPVQGPTYDIADAPTTIVAAKEAGSLQGPGQGQALSTPTVKDALAVDRDDLDPAVDLASVPVPTAASVSASASVPEQEDEKSSETSKQETQQPGQTTLFEEEKSMEGNTQSAKAKDAEVSTDQQTGYVFDVLSVGTKVNDRYEVVQIVKSEPDEHIYEVLDHKGYLHCWSCNSQDNAEGDEYCANCGAQLFEVTYLMHEYPATPSGQSSAPSQEASVLPSKLVDTFVESGHTYAVEQPQTEQNSFPTGVRLLAAGDSDAGNLRRSDPNEDSTLVLLLQRVHESLSSPSGIFLVADGLGGHSNGQYASRLAVNVIADRVVRDMFLSPLSTERGGEAQGEQAQGAVPTGGAVSGSGGQAQGVVPTEEVLLGILQGAIEDANTTICQVNQHDKTDMGCTLTGFMIAGDRAYIFNVGDSRTYILRDETIYQLTKDHSLVGQLVEGGLIEPDDVYSHPQRSQIYRSIGDKLNVQIDLFKQQIHPGDVLLSCSDGLWEMVRDPQITEILNAAPDPQTACTQLIEAANTNGGEDNVSAVVVFVR
jgi:serine/threonine protein phosphatase PrpC